MTGSVKDACVLIHQLGSARPEDLTRLCDELNGLDERQLELDRKLRDAAVRLRYCGDQDGLLRAKADEREYLAALDHLMTRIRAVEAKLLLTKRRLREAGRAHLDAAASPSKEPGSPVLPRGAVVQDA